MKENEQCKASVGEGDSWGRPRRKGRCSRKAVFTDTAEAGLCLQHANRRRRIRKEAEERDAARRAAEAECAAGKHLLGHYYGETADGLHLFGCRRTLFCKARAKITVEAVRWWD